jgi:hypothetical protein
MGKGDKDEIFIFHIIRMPVVVRSSNARRPKVVAT